MSNLYAERDIIEQGEHYTKHISAMTCEGLHSKSAIAAELAHRDIEIERLRAKVAELENALENLLSCIMETRGTPSYKAEQAAHKLLREPSNSKPFILRKQAEAVEDMWDKVNPDNPGRSLREEAQRLHQQADEAEKAGGEQ